MPPTAEARQRQMRYSNAMAGHGTGCKGPGKDETGFRIAFGIILALLFA
jgi:hypothetical protein